MLIPASAEMPSGGPFYPGPGPSVSPESALQPLRIHRPGLISWEAASVGEPGLGAIVPELHFQTPLYSWEAAGMGELGADPTIRDIPPETWGALVTGAAVAGAGIFLVKKQPDKVVATAMGAGLLIMGVTSVILRKIL